MRHPAQRRRARTPASLRGVTVAAMVGLALTAAACGSSSSSNDAGNVDSAGVKEAQARVDKARQKPADFVPPGPAFDASKAAGKTVCLLAADLTVPFVQDYSDGMIAGLQADGVDVIRLDHKYDPSLAARQTDQCINQNADAIIADSLPSDILAQAVAAAKDAGVPYIETFVGDPGPVPPPAAARGVTSQLNLCFSCAGRILSDWAVADSGGAADAVAIRDEATPVSKTIVTAMEEQMKSVCPSCTFNQKGVPNPAEWAARLPTLTSSIVKDPSVNYLMPTFDDMSTIMTPSVSAAGAEDRVKTLSYNANKPNLTILRDGGPVGADVGELPAWIGWAIADQTLRVLTGVKPLADHKIPQRLFDETNIDTINLDADPATWFGVDFAAGYKKLWGVQ